MLWQKLMRGHALPAAQHTVQLLCSAMPRRNSVLSRSMPIYPVLGEEGCAWDAVCADYRLWKLMLLTNP